VTMADHRYAVGAWGDEIVRHSDLLPLRQVLAFKNGAAISAWPIFWIAPYQFLLAVLTQRR